MYVSCDGGCLPIVGLDITPPMDAPELISPEEKPKKELSDGEGVCPPEGGSADDLHIRGLTHIGQVGPPPGFLRVLWKGGALDGASSEK